MVTCRLLRYNNLGDFEELDVDDYEPAEFDNWEFDPDAGAVVNAEEITWEDANCSWAPIDGVKIEGPNDSLVIPLKESFYMENSLFSPAIDITFRPGDIEIEFI